MQNLEIQKTRRIDVDGQDPRTSSSVNESGQRFEFDRPGELGRMESQGRVRGVEDIV